MAARRKSARGARESYPWLSRALDQLAHAERLMEAGHLEEALRVLNYARRMALTAAKQEHDRLKAELKED